MVVGIVHLRSTGHAASDIMLEEGSGRQAVGKMVVRREVENGVPQTF